MFEAALSALLCRCEVGLKGPINSSETFSKAAERDLLRVRRTVHSLTELSVSIIQMIPHRACICGVRRVRFIYLHC